MIATFDYINYKGEKKSRRVDVKSLDFLLHPGFGYEAGWFLTGTDIDKGETRSFALTRIVLPSEMVTPHIACRIPLA